MSRDDYRAALRLVLEEWLRASPELMAISKRELADRFQQKHPGEPRPSNEELVAAIMHHFDRGNLDVLQVGKVQP